MTILAHELGPLIPCPVVYRAWARLRYTRTPVPLSVCRGNV